MNLPRVILADDHTVVAEALRHLLAPHFEVVATVADGRALLDSAMSLKPDVIVVDIAMPLLNGLEAGRQLKQKIPGVKLVFLTMNEDPELAVEAMKSGASGYVVKKSAASELLQAIQSALRGKSYVTPHIARRMQESFIRNPQGRRHNESLTPRQREVVQLLAEGKSMKEAADILRVTPRTVAFHKYRIMRDLELKTNADLIHFAIKSRILVGDPDLNELSLAPTCHGGPSSACGRGAAPPRRGSSPRRTGLPGSRL
jgi:DNA-binding NarL/FixJ family response regulator